MSTRVPTTEDRLERIEAAITTLAWWLAQTPDSIRRDEAAQITAILRGEKPLTEAMRP